MDTTERPLHFLLPTGNQILAMVFYADVAAAVSLAMFAELDEWRGPLLIVVGLCGLVITRAVLKRFQRVGIDGPEVRVMTTASLFRWRRFDVADVTSVTYVRVDDEHFLVLELAPNKSRSWVSVRLNGGVRQQESDIDAPVFIGFMRALWRVQPRSKVRGLPSNYRGALLSERPPRPRSETGRRNNSPSSPASGEPKGGAAKRRTRTTRSASLKT